MKRVLQFFAIFLISLLFSSCDFFSDSAEKEFSEAAKKYSENYREAVFNEDKTEFFALVKNVEASVKKMKQPKVSKMHAPKNSHSRNFRNQSLKSA